MSTISHLEVFINFVCLGRSSPSLSNQQEAGISETEEEKEGCGGEDTWGQSEDKRVLQSGGTQALGATFTSACSRLRSRRCCNRADAGVVT